MSHQAGEVTTTPWHSVKTEKSQATGGGKSYQGMTDPMAQPVSSGMLHHRKIIPSPLFF